MWEGLGKKTCLASFFFSVRCSAERRLEGQAAQVQAQIEPKRQVVGFAFDDRSRLGKDIDFADIYHSAHRYATTKSSHPIVLPRGTVWSFKHGRLVLGRESMAIQGHSMKRDFLDELEISESQCQDLAGNSLLAWVQKNKSVTIHDCMNDID